MVKRVKAYLTVEGNFVFSMILFLYYFILMIAFVMFARCLKSQNDFIKGIRDARFTYESVLYNEVIYEMTEDDPDTYCGVRVINPL